MKETEATESNKQARNQKIKITVSDRIRTCTGKPNNFLSYLLDHSNTLDYVRVIVASNEENRKQQGRNKKRKII
jgi:hypothetical protein